MGDADLLREFESGSLPLDAWCHAFHIRVAYLYLNAEPFPRALARLRRSIGAYNTAQGVPDGPESGYHETLGVCWLHLVAASMGGEHHADSRAFHDAHPELHDKRRVLAHYSRDRLLTERAKRRFVAPDLLPLPGPEAAGCGIPDAS